MPIYDFVNKETGEEFSEMMSMSQRESYLAENPNIQQVLNAVNVFSGSRVNKDAGFAENISRIAEAHPTSPLASKVGGKSIKDVKTEQVIAKHRKRSASPPS